MRFKNLPASVPAAALLLLLVLSRSGAANAVPVPAVPLQPFADQVRHLERTLAFLGQPLSERDQAGINRALAESDEQAAVARIEKILDKYALATVSISPESRVDASRGQAPAELIQDGSRIFLVKIVNQGGVTSYLHVTSPNSGNLFATSSGQPVPVAKVTPEEVRDRWTEIFLYSSGVSLGGFKEEVKPERLSGLGVEYMILVIYSRDAGQRSATLSFDVGQGSQDLGFLNQLDILFNIAPARVVKLQVLDDDGRPTMASFIFRDKLGRIYPSPAKRLAPDFYFQPQIYRADGESISLPPGSYTVRYTGGPEYFSQTRAFQVDSSGPDQLDFRLKRWIDPARYGWYSGDHHIHAAGCAHYETPSEGVRPADMDRQVRGEHLNVGCVLTWGPCYYYQKQFFRGRKDNPLSRKDQLLHYDLEVSGFPSSHAGHLVLLDLKDQDYPGTRKIEDWPTWDLPILRWAKSQGATTGFAHSGWGLMVSGDELPNYQIPAYDSIGANEYIVDVTYPHTVDFLSAGDTPYTWELNMWYQALNAGFRTRISGETDFPCIDDRRVGEGRTYAKIQGPLTYDNWMRAIREGASYVSDGRSHLMDFKINGIELGTQQSEVHLGAPGTVHAEVTAAAYLDPTPDSAVESGGPGALNGAVTLPAKLAPPPHEQIRHLPIARWPYWSIERARIGDTRRVPVEIVVNGRPVQRKKIVADGRVQKLAFDFPIRRSSWVAVRILPSSHTNPLFVGVAGKPLQPLCRSIQWCLDGVNQCWTQKAPKISAGELPAARQAYEHAREFYKSLLAGCAAE